MTLQRTSHRAASYIGEEAKPILFSGVSLTSVEDVCLHSLSWSEEMIFRIALYRLTSLQEGGPQCSIQKVNTMVYIPQLLSGCVVTLLCVERIGPLQDWVLSLGFGGLSSTFILPPSVLMILHARTFHGE